MSSFMVSPVNCRKARIVTVRHLTTVHCVEVGHSVYGKHDSGENSCGQQCGSHVVNPCWVGRHSRRPVRLKMSVEACVVGENFLQLVSVNVAHLADRRKVQLTCVPLEELDFIQVVCVKCDA